MAAHARAPRQVSPLGCIALLLTARMKPKLSAGAPKQVPNPAATAPACLPWSLLCPSLPLFFLCGMLCHALLCRQPPVYTSSRSANPTATPDTPPPSACATVVCRQCQRPFLYHRHGPLSHRRQAMPDRRRRGLGDAGGRLQPQGFPGLLSRLLGVWLPGDLWGEHLGGGGGVSVANPVDA